MPHLMYLFPSAQVSYRAGAWNVWMFDCLNPCAMCQSSYTCTVCVTHHLYPCHNRPPRACLQVKAPLCRGLISSLHCSRWMHSLWDSSSHAEPLREEKVRQEWMGGDQQGCLVPSAGRSWHLWLHIWECVPGWRASSALIRGLGRTMLIKHPGFLFTFSTKYVRLWTWF